jgi:hypothetical protein
MEEQYIEGPYPPLPSEIPDLGTEPNERSTLLNGRRSRIDTYDVFTDRQFVGCLLGMLFLGGVLVFVLPVWIAIPIILFLLFGMISESRWWPNNRPREPAEQEQEE